MPAPWEGGERNGSVTDRGGGKDAYARELQAQIAEKNARYQPQQQARPQQQQQQQYGGGGGYLPAIRQSYPQGSPQHQQRGQQQQGQGQHQQQGQQQWEARGFLERFGREAGDAVDPEHEKRMQYGRDLRAQMNVAASRLPQRRGNAPHSDGMYDQPLPRASSLDMSGLPLAKQLQMQAEDERMRKRLQAERERQEERNVQMGLFGGGAGGEDRRPPRGAGEQLFRGFGDEQSRLGGNMFGFRAPVGLQGPLPAPAAISPARLALGERNASAGEKKVIAGVGSGGGIVVGGVSPARVALEGGGGGGTEWGLGIGERGGGAGGGGGRGGAMEGGIWGDGRAGGRGLVEAPHMDKKEYGRELMEQAKQAQGRRDAERLARMQGVTPPVGGEHVTSVEAPIQVRYRPVAKAAAALQRGGGQGGGGGGGGWGGDFPQRQGGQGEGFPSNMQERFGRGGGGAQYFRSEEAPEPRGRGKVQQSPEGSPDKAKEEYKEALRQQQEEKRLLREAERLKQQLLDERDQRDTDYDPYGRVGGGAPLRDEMGNVVTNVRQAGMRGVSYVSAEEPQVEWESMGKAKKAKHAQTIADDGLLDKSEDAGWVRGTWGMEEGAQDPSLGLRAQQGKARKEEVPSQSVREELRVMIQAQEDLKSEMERQNRLMARLRGESDQSLGSHQTAVKDLERYEAVLKQGVDHGAFWSNLNAPSTPPHVPVSPRPRGHMGEEDPVTRLMLEHRSKHNQAGTRDGVLPPEIEPKESRLVFPGDGGAYSGEALPDPGEALMADPRNPINLQHRVAMAGAAMQGYVNAGGMPPSNPMHDAASAGQPDLETVMARNNHRLQVLNRLAVKQSVLKEAESILGNFLNGREGRAAAVPDSELRQFAYGAGQGEGGGRVPVNRRVPGVA